MDRFVKQLRKIGFYAAGGFAHAVPNWWYRRQRPALLAEAERRVAADADFAERLAVSCQAPTFTLPEDEAVPLGAVSGRRHHTYYFDLRRTLRYFPRHLRLAYRFGDVREVPPVPAVVKSRPIAVEGIDNRNAVLLKLNRIRHYRRVHDRLCFRDKRPVLVWRGKVRKKPQRQAFLAAHREHPRCDIGSSDPEDRDEPFFKPFLDVRDQLRCKYILSLEGNDVATNLKWILSSNSLCLMPPPRYETWFLESRLIPDHHYVCLRDDGADFADRIEYFERHPDEAEAIIANAQAYAARFHDQHRERLLEIAVMQRYFERSGQLPV